MNDITLEKTATLLQVPSIDLEELLADKQSTAAKSHSPRQLSEIFRHTSFGSVAMPSHTTTSSLREGFRSASEVNAPEMYPVEELDYPNNEYTVPLDELFFQQNDQLPLMGSEDPQNVPRMSAGEGKRSRSMFDDRIVLSRAEMFLTAEEIEEADLFRIKRPKQMKEDQVLALIDAPLLACNALQINFTGPLLAELMPKTVVVSRTGEDAPPLDYTPFNPDFGYEPVEMLRAISDSTSNVQPLPWSSFGSVPGSDAKKTPEASLIPPSKHGIKLFLDLHPWSPHRVP